MIIKNNEFLKCENSIHPASKAFSRFPLTFLFSKHMLSFKLEYTMTNQSQSQFETHQLVLKWLPFILCRFQLTVRHHHSFLCIFTLLLIALPCAQSYDYTLGLSNECKNHCDKNRDHGWNAAYVLDCNKKYSSENERQQCRDQCSQCPSFVCNKWGGGGSNIFNCPKTKLEEGKCKARCDKTRNDNLNGFELNCVEDGESSYDIQSCTQECGDCPSWVCDPETDRNMYYCPPVDYDDGPCQNTCEHFRTQHGYNERIPWSYIFTCDQVSWEDRDKCRDNCDKCPKAICQKNGLSTNWKCPPKSSPQPLPTTTTTTTTEKPRMYEGACKQRCDKFRLGGRSSYKLNCNILFSSESEKRDCLNDCKLKCPPENCDKSSDSLDCPELDKYQDGYVTPRKKSPLTKGLKIAVFFDVLLTTLLMIAACAYWENRRLGRQVTEGGGVQTTLTTTTTPQATSEPAASSPS